MPPHAELTDQRVKVLFLASNPVTMSALRLTQEVRQIEEKISASKYRAAIEFIVKWAVRPDDLQQVLLSVEPHIVHFSGHGSEREGLYFESPEGISAPVDRESLVELLTILKDNIRLVMLNACQTHALAEAITAHIDCAIGTRVDIGDEAAIEFSAAFYRAIGFGRSIKVAFDLGRSALRLKQTPEDRIPVLYVRPGVDPGKVTFVDGNLADGNEPRPHTPQRKWPRVVWAAGAAVTAAIVTMMFIVNTNILNRGKQTKPAALQAATVAAPTRPAPTNARPDMGIVDAGDISFTSASAIPPPSPPSGSCPERMVLIKGGTFTMGSPPGEGGNDEHPPREVKLSAFCMDKTEVTVEQYRACASCDPETTTVNHPRYSSYSPKKVMSLNQYCNAKRADRDKHPINCVDWTQASAYCTSIGGRLPTEAEWEYAARGAEGRKYPWGKEPPDETRLNVCGGECVRVHPGSPTMHPADDHWSETAPVGSYPKGATPLGLLDMAGNVWEWTAGVYAGYTSNNDVLVDPQGPPMQSEADARVIRGGGWNDNNASAARSAYRNSSPPSVRIFNVGFRCARGPISPPQSSSP